MIKKPWFFSNLVREEGQGLKDKDESQDYGLRIKD